MRKEDSWRISCTRPQHQLNAIQVTCSPHPLTNSSTYTTEKVLSGCGTNKINTNTFSCIHSGGENHTEPIMLIQRVDATTLRVFILVFLSFSYVLFISSLSTLFLISLCHLCLVSSSRTVIYLFILFLCCVLTLRSPTKLVTYITLFHINRAHFSMGCRNEATLL